MEWTCDPLANESFPLLSYSGSSREGEDQDSVGNVGKDVFTEFSELPEC